MAYEQFFLPKRGLQQDIMNKCDNMGMVSAVCGCEHQLAFGYLCGKVFLLFLDTQNFHIIEDHKEPITAMAFSKNTSYFTSVSKDLQLFVYKCPTTKAFETDAQPKISLLLHLSSTVILSCISMHPMFSAFPSTHMIATGAMTGDVMLYHKMVFSWEVSLLSREETPITGIEWHPTAPLLVYGTFTFIHIIDLNSCEIIISIPFLDNPHEFKQNRPFCLLQSSAPEEVYSLKWKAFIQWVSPEHGLLALGTTLKICELNVKKLNEKGKKKTPWDEHESNSISIHLTHELRFKYLICGMGITFLPEATQDLKNCIIHTLLFSSERGCPNSESSLENSALLHSLSKCDGVEIQCDRIPLTITDNCALPYSLITCGRSLPKFLQCGDSLYKMVKVTLEEVCFWYFKIGQGDTALKEALEGGSHHLIWKVIKTYVHQCFQNGDFTKAICLLYDSRLEVLQKEKTCLFLCNLCVQKNMICSLISHLKKMLEAFPNQSSTILRICLEGLAFSNINDLKKSFLNGFNNIFLDKSYLEIALITVLPLNENDVRNKNTTVHQNKSLEPVVILHQCQAILLEKNNSLRLAFRLLLKSQISQHLLYTLMEKRCLQKCILLYDIIIQNFEKFCRYGIEKFANFLAKDQLARDAQEMPLFPFSMVVQYLQPFRFGLFCYLYTCFKNNAIKKKNLSLVCNQYISLLAEYKADYLLNFIKTLFCENPKLLHARYVLSICARHKKQHLNQNSAASEKTVIYLCSAQVFLFYTIGAFSKALRILLYELQDVETAVTLALSSPNHQCYKDLIVFIHQNPKVIRILFQCFDKVLLKQKIVHVMPGWPKNLMDIKNFTCFLPPLTFLKTIFMTQLVNTPSLYRVLSTIVPYLDKQEVLHSVCETIALSEVSHFQRACVAKLKRGVTISPSPSILPPERSINFLQASFSMCNSQTYPKPEELGKSGAWNNFSIPLWHFSNTAMIVNPSKTLLIESHNRAKAFSSLTISNPSLCSMCFSPFKTCHRHVTVFQCGHAAHTVCLRQCNTMVCILCSQFQYVSRFPLLNFFTV
ncbi:uncharacterized protein LOC128883515 isoform X2 [Hylaeus volcanicus]|uniref:uncharacterized protein LOC128883515 isoform X2 n=1 Tax=Hylaeus volcanicus TaxID=313075 RepID=UPI0023B778D1|nr:uncharacterized protein LOC128883515 isoform X2 [Hylaeus volcanicus]